MVTLVSVLAHLRASPGASRPGNGDPIEADSAYLSGCPCRSLPLDRVLVWSRLAAGSPLHLVAEVEKASESRDRGVGTSEDLQIRLDAGGRDPPAGARRPSNCLPLGS